MRLAAVVHAGVLHAQDLRRSWLQQAPGELTGSSPRLVLWVQVNTCQELNASGAIVELDESTWRQRYERLQALGGPPRQRFALRPPRYRSWLLRMIFLFWQGLGTNLSMMLAPRR